MLAKQNNTRNYAGMTSHEQHGLQVVVFEDDLWIQALIRRHVEKSKHTLVAEAGTIEDALQVVENIGNSSILADVILLDGTLGGDRERGHHATIIYDRMRALGLTTRIIGISMDPLSNFIPMDIDLTKTGIANGGLAPALDSLAIISEQ